MTMIPTTMKRKMRQMKIANPAVIREPDKED
jgi:hypothetical protein